VSGRGITWLASYPKSGNTWTRIILATLAAGGRRPALSEIARYGANAATFAWMRSIVDIPPDDLLPDERRLLRAEAVRLHAAAAPGFAPLKVHDRYDDRLAPGAPVAGILYIVRDPRDVTPSFADHCNVTLDRAVTMLNTPDYTLSTGTKTWRPQAPQTTGSWSQHVRSWTTGHDHPLLVLRYEDMLADPCAAIEQIADFTGMSVDRACVEATAKACAFGAIRAEEDAHGFAERQAGQRRFFRQGRSGAWREVLSDDQAAALWRHHGDVMRSLGYAP
jgi:hypothetical protein